MNNYYDCRKSAAAMTYLAAAAPTPLRHAICNVNLTTLVLENGEMQSTDHNLSQAIRNNEKGLHNLTTSVQENKQAIHNLIQAVKDFHPIHSCNETKSARPGSTSGNYTILDGNGTLREVYCHMEQICDSSHGLDESDPPRYD